MPFLKTYHFHVAVCVVAILSGCSQSTSSTPPSARQQLNQSKFEIDQQRGLVLTHAATANQLESKPPTFSQTAQASSSPTEEAHRPQVCEIELPILHIATGEERIADEPKVAATLKILEPGCEPERFPIAIEWRGKTSQTFPKKSFGFELRDRNHFESPIKRSLLDMRKDDDWILDALWNEPIAIRDFTAHEIWRRMAADHKNCNDYDLPQQRYCELFLDGQYCGVYYLGERVDPKMFKLKKHGGPSHGRQFKAVSWADASSFRSLPPVEPPYSQWSGFETVYPKAEENANWNSLRELIGLVAEADSIEFNEAIGREVHLDNAVDYFIFINLLAAMDNRGKNYYLVRQSEFSPWFFVPWDLDLTAGICFPTERKDVMESRMYNQLFRRLMRQPEFVQAVTDRWNHLRSGLFKKENLKSLYRQNFQCLTDNGVYDRQQQFPELRANFDSPESEMEFLEQWLDSRIDFLDGWFGNTTRLVKRLKREQDPSFAPAKR